MHCRAAEASGDLPCRHVPYLAPCSRSSAAPHPHGCGECQSFLRATGRTRAVGSASSPSMSMVFAVAPKLLRTQRGDLLGLLAAQGFAADDLRYGLIGFGSGGNRFSLEAMGDV